MTEKIGVLFIVAQEEFGADTAVHADIIRNLDRDKFSVHVACTDGGGKTVPASLAVMQKIPRISLRPTRFAPSLRRSGPSMLAQSARTLAQLSWDFVALRRYIESEGIRIVHSTERPRDVAYNIALSRLAGTRSVAHIHVKWSEEYGRLAKWGVRNADAVFSISRFVTNAVVGMGIPRARVHTVLNAIEPSKWDPGIDGSAFRRELGIPQDSLVLTSVSRLFSWKGQRELVRAFALVREKIQNAELVIVGADYSMWGGESFTAELKALARARGVLEHVHFTGGRPDIPNVMAGSDVFTMASFEEPFGLVFLEAMAMRKPVIAINNGGTPEVVEHGRSGLLSPPWDIPALAANIVRLLEDRDLREQMGSYGRSRVLDYFNAQRMAQEAGAAYERILKGEPSVA
ncbi:MAG TPA: glycosyltransferase family 4 protein [Polyangiaceae bacterium]|nr:glycosyltransferase family 4 protein [Polyangiaceae bacterium]